MPATGATKRCQKNDEIEGLRADVDKWMSNLKTQVESKSYVEALERQMRATGTRTAQMYMAIQSEIGAYTQDWKGLQTQRRQLDIERASVEQHFQRSKKDTSVKDRFSALETSIQSFYDQKEDERS
eukprot:jgi/Ulvmu1/9283/UM050_0032.1